MMSLIKNLYLPTKNFFRVQSTRRAESLSLISGLQRLPDQRNSRTKPRAIQLFFREPLELTSLWVTAHIKEENLESLEGHCSYKRRKSASVHHAYCKRIVASIKFVILFREKKLKPFSVSIKAIKLHSTFPTFTTLNFMPQH